QGAGVWGGGVRAAMARGGGTFEPSRDYVAAYRLQILVENGQRERAIDLARARGWVREGRDFCAARDLPVSSGMAALLAVLLQPQRADSVLESGADAGGDGLARLRRLMLRGRR